MSRSMGMPSKSRDNSALRTIYFVDYPSRENTRKITPLMCNDAVCTSLGEAIGSVMNPFRKSLYSSVRSRNGYCFESRLQLREESWRELHTQSGFHIHVCVNFCRPPSKTICYIAKQFGIHSTSQTFSSKLVKRLLWGNALDGYQVPKMRPRIQYHPVRNPVREFPNLRLRSSSAI